MSTNPLLNTKNKLIDFLASDTTIPPQLSKTDPLKSLHLYLLYYTATHQPEKVDGIFDRFIKPLILNLRDYDTNYKEMIYYCIILYTHVSGDKKYLNSIKEAGFIMERLNERLLVTEIKNLKKEIDQHSTNNYFPKDTIFSRIEHIICECYFIHYLKKYSLLSFNKYISLANKYIRLYLLIVNNPSLNDHELYKLISPSII